MSPDEVQMVKGVNQLVLDDATRQRLGVMATDFKKLWNDPCTSAQQVKTPTNTVKLVDNLLDHHIYSEIADILNQQGLRPGGSDRPGRSSTRFTAQRIIYLVHQYALRPRYDRLRDRGMLTAAETAARLHIHGATVIRWAAYGLITKHAYNAHAYLYEVPESNLPAKHSSHRGPLADRVAALKTARESKPSDPIEGGAV